MDSGDIRVFINNLNIQLNVFSFDYMTTIAMPFRDLARANIVSNKAFRSLNIPERFSGRMLKELLKPIGIATSKSSTFYASKCVSTKRKDISSSSCLGCSGKRMKNTQGDSIETDYCRTGSVTVIAKDQKHVEVKVQENEDKINLEDEEFSDAIQHLNEFLEKENLKNLRIVLSKSRDEGELEVGLGIHLLSKLAGEAFTSTEKSLKRCPCGCLEKLQSTEKMWIGSENTWYGELDIITGNPSAGNSVSVSVGPKIADDDTELQGKSEQLLEQSEVEDEDNIEDNSENDSVDIKTKVNYIVAQAVVFAFTEYNRHKSKGNCIPSILIDKSGFQFVIYNPVDDILLVSNHITFVEEECFNLGSGYGPFVLLWIILNHRIFFSEHLDFKTHCVKSSFHEKWSDMHHFKSLAEYSRSIALDQFLSFPDDTPKILTHEGLYHFFKRKTTS